MPAYFNASSGVLRKNKNFVFGSTDGAIELPQNVKFPDYVYTKMNIQRFEYFIPACISGRRRFSIGEKYQ